MIPDIPDFPWVDLHQNKDLLTLAEIFATTSPNWELLRRSVLTSPAFRRSRGDEGNIRGAILETHINLILWDLIKHDLGIQHIMIPENGLSTASYTLFRDDPNAHSITAIDRISRITMAEHDAIIAVGNENDQLVTVIEATTSLAKNLKNEKNKLLLPEVIASRFHPLVELFDRTSFAYLLCIVDGIQNENSPYRNDFQSRHGLITQVPMEKQDLDENAKDLSSQLIHKKP